MIKNYLKSYGYLIILSLALTLITSVISYIFNISLNITKLIIPIISMFISTIILGKNIKEKGYLEGIKYSSLFLLLISIIKLIVKSNFNYKVIIMYIALIITSIIGASIGINLKRNS